MIEMCDDECLMKWPGLEGGSDICVCGYWVSVMLIDLID